MGGFINSLYSSRSSLHFRALLASLVPQSLASPVVHGTYYLQPFPSADFKGILSTHADGSVRVWDCEHGRELFAFSAAEPSSGYLRAVSTSRQPVSDTSAGDTEGSTCLVQTIGTGDGDGWVKTWTVPASVLANAGVKADVDKTTTAELTFPSSNVFGQTLVAAEGSERCKYEAV